ncbi:MAG: M20 family metallopeptidase [Alphaproteobacteria bacterium]|nr:M20 family metallopeptidase [Alphaproteobacteria bacterium]
MSSLPAPDPARLVDLLARLVGCDTQNGLRPEAPAADLLDAHFRGLGFGVARQDVLPERPNLIVRLDNGPGPCFAFNTHMDVVPAGSGWSGDPFTLRQEGARLVGRGACDAKGPLAAMAEAMALIAANRGAWRGTLLGVWVIDEEAESRGAKAFAKAWPAMPGSRPIDACAVGEPTSNRIATAHKGSLRPEVRVKGRMAHSANPDLGLNAIGQAAILVPRLLAFHRDVLAARAHPLVGGASLTITRAQAGIADNIVPDACTLLLDRRLIPGEAEADAIAEIERLLATAKAETGVEAEITSYRPTTGGAAETAADHPLVQAALAASRAAGVADPGPMGFSAACDFVHFRSLGAQGAVLGPGDIAVAHKPDEFVPRAELIAAASIYRDMAMAVLGRA